MTLRAMRVLAVLLLSGVGCMALDEARDRGATRLAVPDPAFRDVRIVPAKSMPPQFRVTLTRDMPTPGWKFEVDEVKVDAESGRIVARITEHAPGGIVSQVIKPTRLDVELGILPRGTYLLELWARRGADGGDVLMENHAVPCVVEAGTFPAGIGPQVDRVDLR